MTTLSGPSSRRSDEDPTPPCRLRRQALPRRCNTGENREIESIAKGATAFLQPVDKLARWEANSGFADQPHAVDIACDAYAKLLDRIE